MENLLNFSELFKKLIRATTALFLFSCTAGMELVQISTPKGDIWFRFYKQTPRHREAFIRLAKQHYWDSLCFNRVIPDFVAQGGCPDTPEGFGNSPYLLDPEFHDSLRHVYGAVGAGRDDNPGKRSATCQFYIVQNKNGIPRLDGKYTVFGQVVRGMEVVDAICKSPRDKYDAPLERIHTKIRVRKVVDSDIRKLNLE
jgi:peptidyl-prolyl cis-trans isomerase B (cyclophilin B)